MYHQSKYIELYHRIVKSVTSVHMWLYMMCECIVPSPATAASSASAQRFIPLDRVPTWLSKSKWVGEPDYIPQEFRCRLICFIDYYRDLQCKHTSFLHSGLSKAEVFQSQIANVGCYKYSSWPPAKKTYRNKAIQSPSLHHPWLYKWAVDFNVWLI